MCNTDYNHSRKYRAFIHTGKRTLFNDRGMSYLLTNNMINNTFIEL